MEKSLNKKHTFGKNSNSILAPIGAMMLLGLKASLPFSPTVTLRGVDADAVTAGGACA